MQLACPFRAPLPDSCTANKDLLDRKALVVVEQSPSVIAVVVVKRFKASGEAAFHLCSPAILSTNHAAPCGEALGRMLLHPLGELRRAHQAGLQRDVGEVRGGDGLFVAICRRGETAQHGDDLDHDRRPPSLRLAPLTVWLIGAL